MVISGEIQYAIYVPLDPKSRLWGLQWLADLGPDRAMPKLDEILDTAIGLPHWRERRPLIDDLPIYPNQSAHSVERSFRQVANKLRRYEQDNAMEQKQ